MTLSMDPFLFTKTTLKIRATIQKVYLSEAKAAKLTKTELDILLFTYMAPNNIISSSEIIDICDINKSQLSRNSDTLKAKGMITKTKDVTNKKNIQFALTEVGYQVAKPITIAISTAITDRLESLDPEEKHYFKNSLSNF